MAALSDDLKLLLVVLILLFAPGMVESAFSKVEQHEQQELAISGNNNQRSQEKTDFERAGKVTERNRERGQLLTFTYIRE